MLLFSDHADRLELSLYRYHSVLWYGSESPPSLKEDTAPTCPRNLGKYKLTVNDYTQVIGYGRASRVVLLFTTSPYPLYFKFRSARSHVTLSESCMSAAAAAM